MSLPDFACTVAYVTFFADTMPELFEKIASWREWENFDVEHATHLGPIEVGFDDTNGLWASFGLADSIETLPADTFILDL